MTGGSRSRTPSDRAYQERVAAPESIIASESVPGLEFRVRPESAWRFGSKVDVFFQGQRRAPLAEERARAEQEKARADRLAERLRAAGIDPDEL